MTVAPRIAVLDYGMGNVRSAEKALEHVGAVVDRTADHDLIASADGLVLPGDGAFPEAMRRLHALGLDALVRERHAAGVAVLGLCVGMQLLFEASEERGGAEGLGLMAGRVVALAADGLKVPHIGWNPVRLLRAGRIVAGLPDPCPFYHVHSFAPAAARSDDIVGTAVYGSEFVSIVESGNLFGVQFHPEKSGPDGLALLRNFALACGERTAASPAAAAPGA